MSRRTKWHPTPPPPPSPKILHFPRSRRSRRRRKPHNNLITQNYLSFKANHLESLFDHGLPLQRRERVEEREEEEEEKSKFEAESNLLRMERELGLNKLEKNRMKMETTLRSAGRKKIVEGKKSGNEDSEGEIEDLAEKLEELHMMSSRINNYDNKADPCLTINTEKSSSSSSSLSLSDCKNNDKSSTTTTTTHGPMVQESKCSGRCKAVVLRIMEQVKAETEQWSQMQRMLEQVRAEMEELQASRDYWETRARASECQIQSLRDAVEEWRERAVDYEKEINQLQLKLLLAKEKKMHKTKLDLRPAAENNNHLVLDLPPVPVPLGAQLVKERLAFTSHSHNNYRKFDKDFFLEEINIEEVNKKESTPKKNIAPLSLAKQLAKEKRSLVRSFRENRCPAQHNDSKQELKEEGTSRRYLNRSPLTDIGNSSPSPTQNHRAAFVYHSPESSRIRESFRK